jgi:hypothetical protein
MQLWLRPWAPYISYYRYPFQGFVLNDFKDNSNLPFGQQYLELLGFDTLSQWTCGYVSLIFAIGYAFFSLLPFVYVNHQKR